MGKVVQISQAQGFLFGFMHSMTICGKHQASHIYPTPKKIINEKITQNDNREAKALANQLWGVKCSVCVITVEIFASDFDYWISKIFHSILGIFQITDMSSN